MALLLVSGVLLLLDTTAAWQKELVGRHHRGILEQEGRPIYETHSAWHGVWGISMGVALVALLSWFVLRGALMDDAPKLLLINDAWVVLGLAATVFTFALLKNATDANVYWPARVGLVLAAFVAIGALIRAVEVR